MIEARGVIGKIPNEPHKEQNSSNSCNQQNFSRIRDAKMGNSLFNQSKPPEVASTIRFEESISAEVHSRPSKTMKTICIDSTYGFHREESCTCGTEQTVVYVDLYPPIISCRMSL